MNNFHNNPIKDNISNVDLFYRTLRDSHYAAALALAPSLEQSQDVSTLYNLAVLYGYIDERERAIGYVDRALIAIKKQMVPKNNLPRPEKYVYTRMLEIKCKSYLTPMTTEYALEFPTFAREDILMLGAYNANMNGMIGMRDTYLSSLHGPEFDEFKKYFKGI